MVLLPFEVGYHFSTISRQNIALAIGTAIFTMGIFFGASMVLPTIVASIFGAGTISYRIHKRNAMLEINKLFEDYINCVNNIYMV